VRHFSLSFLSLQLGPTGQSPPLSSPMRVLLFYYSIFFNSIQSKMGYNSNGDENLQSLYRWKALDEENPLKQLIFKMVYCVSLALEKKGIGQKMELAV
jgi:hypothetical protein